MKQIVGKCITTLPLKLKKTFFVKNIDSLRGQG